MVCFNLILSWETHTRQSISTVNKWFRMWWWRYGTWVWETILTHLISHQWRDAGKPRAQHSHFPLFQFCMNYLLYANETENIPQSNIHHKQTMCYIACVCIHIYSQQLISRYTVEYIDHHLLLAEKKCGSNGKKNNKLENNVKQCGLTQNEYSHQPCYVN